MGGSTLCLSSPNIYSQQSWILIRAEVAIKGLHKGDENDASLPKME